MAPLPQRPFVLAFAAGGDIMVMLRPFRALRYDPNIVGDLSAVVIRIVGISPSG